MGRLVFSLFYSANQFLTMKLIIVLFITSIALDVSSSLKPETRLSYNLPQQVTCGQKLNQSNGTITSHAGYSTGHLYSPSLRCRWEINSTKKGYIAAKTHGKIGMRNYDYLVFIDGSLKHRLTFICNVEKYKELGTGGVQFLGVNQTTVMSQTDATFNSSTNRMFVDFCSHVFPLGTSRTGFEILFDTVSWEDFSSKSPTATPSSPATAKSRNTPQSMSTWRFFTSTTSIGKPSPRTTNMEIHSTVTLGKFSFPVPTFAPSTSPTTRHLTPPLNITGSTCGMPAAVPDNREPRIIGGKIGKKGMWPWMCALLFGRRQQCGCTIVAREWVLTAGHCFPRVIIEQSEDVKMAIVIGAQDLKEARIRNLFQIDRIIRHEDFINYRGISHDIALVKLKVPLEFGSNIQPACLPTEPLDRFSVDGKIDCFIAGWGITKKDQTVMAGEVAVGPDELHQLPVDTLFTKEECHKAINKEVSDVSSQVRITDSMFCAGFKVKQGGFDACQGDSGGPLVCQIQEQWALYGLVSYGLRCAEPGVPGVYTNIYALKQWIERTMDQN